MNAFSSLNYRHYQFPKNCEPYNLLLRGTEAACANHPYAAKAYCVHGRIALAEVLLRKVLSPIGTAYELTSRSQTFLLLTCSMKVIFFLLRGKADGVVEPPEGQ